MHLRTALCKLKWWPTRSFSTCTAADQLRRREWLRGYGGGSVTLRIDGPVAFVEVENKKARNALSGVMMVGSNQVCLLA